MFNRFVATAAALAATSIAFSQGLASVDLLEPAETSGTIPTNTRIVDVFFNHFPSLNLVQSINTCNPTTRSS